MLLHVYKRAISASHIDKYQSQLWIVPYVTALHQYSPQILHHMHLFQTVGHTVPVVLVGH